MPGLHISYLPDELLGHCLSFLSTQDRHCSAPLVSRRWARLAQSPALLRATGSSFVFKAGADYIADEDDDAHCLARLRALCSWSVALRGLERLALKNCATPSTGLSELTSLTALCITASAEDWEGLEEDEVKALETCIQSSVPHLTRLRHLHLNIGLSYHGMEPSVSFLAGLSQLQRLCLLVPILHPTLPHLFAVSLRWLAAAAFVLGPNRAAISAGAPQLECLAVFYLTSADREDNKTLWQWRCATPAFARCAWC
ncbi:hypothetical protein ABPG75_004113 [Micractinium tetrahymenae]